MTGSLLACRDYTPAFTPGPDDPRLTGTWRLAERRFRKDSTFSVTDTNKIPRRDTGTIIRDGKAIRFDTVATIIETIRTPRDTSFDVLRRYPATPPQTLTFGADGRLTANGSEMTYFNPIRTFLLDRTFPDSLFINLYIATNGANVPSRMRLAFQRDTLTLLPGCETPCWLKFVRAQ
ncbi:hypothetical protein AWR27_19635 [Spirosoma montaniterrae]|uniref:Uncharacterized protein n=1 Tax=Spirosoma montaniterrae TaxID=1178516 RepID=A0A1P9X125_9BACT|nr:hypothetical protein AWR27_19635 [Spirosoma montaniterrae]